MGSIVEQQVMCLCVLYYKVQFWQEVGLLDVIGLLGWYGMNFSFYEVGRGFGVGGIVLVKSVDCFCWRFGRLYISL